MTGYAVKLSLQIRHEDSDWVVWCPGIDVATQARTRKLALESLGEAVELWFESCISRGVLDRALQESGFRKVCGATTTRDVSDCVTVRVTQTPDKAVAVPDIDRCRISEGLGDNFLEGFIPASLTEDDLGSDFRPIHGGGAPKHVVLGAKA